MLHILLRHRVFAVYMLSLAWLATSAGAYASYAGRPMDSVVAALVVMAITAAVYVGAWQIARRLGLAWTATSVARPELSRRNAHILLGLVLLYGAVVASHFGILGFIPVVEALQAEADTAVSVVRQRGYFELPAFMRYLSDYSTKAIGPALLLVTYYFRSRLFWPVLAIGLFYTTGLFARILPIVLFLPLLVYMVTARRWAHAVAVVSLLCLQLVLLTAVASTAIRSAAFTGTDTEQPVVLGEVPKDIVPPPPRPTDWRRTSVVYAFYDRMFIVPGQVIDQWFQYYGNPQRQERGCGYRPLARLLGCDYVPIPSKLYAVFYRENVLQGMRGSLNAASFMTEYANFGPAGFILSGVGGGLLLALVMLIYGNHPLALSLNLPMIMTSMESNLLTAVNSGSGWLVMTLIFLLFFRLRKP